MLKIMFYATVPLPASMNRTASYRANRTMLEMEIGAFAGIKLDRKARYELTLVFHFRANHGQDLLNYDKTLVDVLCKVLCINDSQFDRVTLIRGDCRDPANVDIEIIRSSKAYP